MSLGISSGWLYTGLERRRAWCSVPGAACVRANGPVNTFHFRGTRMLSTRDTSKIVYTTSDYQTRCVNYTTRTSASRRFNQVSPSSVVHHPRSLLNSRGQSGFEAKV